jgi:hypothetical protein
MVEAWAVGVEGTIRHEVNGAWTEESFVHRSPTGNLKFCVWCSTRNYFRDAA